MIIKAEELKALVVRILVTAGASKSNADCVAAHLVSANLSGVDTHGVWHLARTYLPAIKSGEIVPDAVPEILTEAPVSALVTGHYGTCPKNDRYGLGRRILGREPSRSSLRRKKARAEHQPDLDGISSGSGRSHVDRFCYDCRFGRESSER